MKKIIIGITGATGVIYGVRLLEILKSVKDIEIHLIVSSSAERVLKLETNISLKKIKEKVDFNYDNSNIGARISSGSFITSGMIIIPCSIKTLSNIVNSCNYDLISRAADVVLKERRKLVLGVRETPLHIGHLKLMIEATKIGSLIFPPLPAFYYFPKTIEDIIDQSLSRLLDQYGICLPKKLFNRWDS